MKSRPIIFGDEMVRAILDGRKTQTRRVVKLGPSWFNEDGTLKDTKYWRGEEHVKTINPRYCPFGLPGDRLWVRETFKDEGDRVVYEADRAAFYREEPVSYFYLESGYTPARWSPPIHMPRWASRIDLEVTAVRVERLQEISTTDALAEGMRWDSTGESATNGTDTIFGEGRYAIEAAFQFAWNRLNARRGFAWETDPWVWVIDFKRVL